MHESFYYQGNFIANTLKRYLSVHQIWICSFVCKRWNELFGTEQDKENLKRLLPVPGCLSPVNILAQHILLEPRTKADYSVHCVTQYFHENTPYDAEDNVINKDNTEHHQGNIKRIKLDPSTVPVSSSNNNNCKPTLMSKTNYVKWFCQTTKYRVNPIDLLYVIRSGDAKLLDELCVGYDRYRAGIYPPGLKNVLIAAIASGDMDMIQTINSRYLGNMKYSDMQAANSHDMYNNETLNMSLPWDPNHPSCSPGDVRGREFLRRLIKNETTREYVRSRSVHKGRVLSHLSPKDVSTLLDKLCFSTDIPKNEFIIDYILIWVGSYYVEKGMVEEFDNFNEKIKALWELNPSIRNTCMIKDIKDVMQALVWGESKEATEKVVFWMIENHSNTLRCHRTVVMTYLYCYAIEHKDASLLAFFDLATTTKEEEAKRKTDPPLTQYGVSAIMNALSKIHREDRERMLEKVLVPKEEKLTTVHYYASAMKIDFGSSYPSVPPPTIHQFKPNFNMMSPLSALGSYVVKVCGNLNEYMATVSERYSVDVSQYKTPEFREYATKFTNTLWEMTKYIPKKRKRVTNVPLAIRSVVDSKMYIKVTVQPELEGGNQVYYVTGNHVKQQFLWGNPVLLCEPGKDIKERHKDVNNNNNNNSDNDGNDDDDNSATISVLTDKEDYEKEGGTSYYKSLASTMGVQWGNTAKWLMVYSDPRYGMSKMIDSAVYVLTKGGRQRLSLKTNNECLKLCKVLAMLIQRGIGKEGLDKLMTCVVDGHNGRLQSLTYPYDGHHQRVILCAISNCNLDAVTYLHAHRTSKDDIQSIADIVFDSKESRIYIRDSSIQKKR